jgi:hypothetical protein
MDESTHLNAARRKLLERRQAMIKDLAASARRGQRTGASIGIAVHSARQPSRLPRVKAGLADLSLIAASA